MAVKAGISYNVCKDRIEGFENFGNIGVGQEVGKQALTFMATGIFSSWKQPLGYSIQKADTLHALLFECLEAVKECGLQVKCIICDQGTNNQKLFNILKVTPEQPNFSFNEDKIFVKFDPPHLLKSIRNNLNSMISNLMATIFWKYLEQMFEIDTSKSVGLRLVPKLTRKHLKLPAF